MRSSGRRRSGFLALMALAIPTLAILFVFDPAEYRFYPVCYFHLVTGLNCPGCGSMRAVHALLHGHIGDAARLNLLFLLSLPIAVWSGGRYSIRWLYGQPLAFAIRPVWLWTFLVVSMAFTLVRNLPGFGLAP